METKNVLGQFSDHVMVFAMVQYAPQIAHVRKLPVAAEVLLKQSKLDSWSTTSDDKYIIRDTKEEYFYLLDFQSIFLQVLGLNGWVNNIDLHAERFSTAINKLDVTRCKQVQIVVTAFLPLGMKHSELNELVYEGYIPDYPQLSDVYGSFYDVLLQFYGKHGDETSVTVIAPQTPEQSKLTFKTTGAPEAFITKKFEDDVPNSFFQRLDSDALSLTITVTKANVAVREINSAFSRCFEIAQSIADGTVLRVRAIHPEGK